MSSSFRRVRWRCLALATLLVSSIAPGWRPAHAASVTSFSWTNSTAHATTDLRLEIDTADAFVSPDAVFQFQLSELIGVPASAAIDTALLATAMDGTFDVSLASHAITLTRNSDGSALPEQTALAFVLTGLETPVRAGAVVLGTLVVSNATHPSVLELVLPTMLVTPGRIWHARVAFSSLVSGRAASLVIEMAPANAIPADGSIRIALPAMYGSQSAAALESVSGLDGDVSLIALQSQLRVLRAPGSGTATSEAQAMSVRIAGIVHPLLEAPVGSAIRIDTLDGLDRLIDQVYIDTSGVGLERARVVLSTRRLVATEGAAVASTYTLHLSAPPVADHVTVLVSPDAAASSAVSISPDRVVFAPSNWSTPTAIAVSVRNDDVARGDHRAETSVTLTHAIAEAETTERTYAAVDSLQLVLEDNDVPLVRVSSRFAAVVEGLRNATYDIVLTSEPRAVVRVDLAPDDAFVTTTPRFVEFVPSAWSTPQRVTVIGAAPPTTSADAMRQSRRTCVRHAVASIDPNFDASRLDVVVPQSDLLVYYEPLELDQCVEPCRPGWFAFANVSSGASLCLACPLGSFCAGGCANPAPCPAGTFSNASNAASALACHDCPRGSYANQAGMVTCLACPAGASCSSPDRAFKPCPVGTWSPENDSECHECPAGSYNNLTLQGRCFECPAGYYCPLGSSSPQRCADGTVSADGGASACGPCPAGYDCTAALGRPMRCADGSYSLLGDASCSPCPRGYACPQSDQPPRACVLGTTSATASTICTPCPIGHACADASVDPVPCTLGTYSSSSSSTLCRACPAGHSCADPSLSPSACLPGAYSLEVRVRVRCDAVGLSRL